MSSRDTQTSGVASSLGTPPRLIPSPEPSLPSSDPTNSRVSAGARRAAPLFLLWASALASPGFSLDLHRYLHICFYFWTAAPSPASHVARELPPARASEDPLRISSGSNEPVTGAEARPGQLANLGRAQQAGPWAFLHDSLCTSEGEAEPAAETPRTRKSLHQEAPPLSKAWLHHGTTRAGNSSWPHLGLAVTCFTPLL